METLLQRLKEACKESSEQQNPVTRLQDIIMYPKTGEFSFIWKEEEK